MAATIIDQLNGQQKCKLSDDIRIFSSLRFNGTVFLQDKWKKWQLITFPDL